MLFDEGSTTGLKAAINMINNEVTETLRLNLSGNPLDAVTLGQVDAILREFYLKNLFKGEQTEGVNFIDMTGPGMSIIRACSEALFFGVVACLKNDTTANQVIRDNLHPFGDNSTHFTTVTKLLLSVL